MPAGGSQNSKATLEFLGGLGDPSKSDNIPLGNTAEALVKLGEYLIKTASANLQKKGHVATGNTISSMKIVNLDTRTTKMSLDIEILSTYKFLDQGVRGLEGGKGKYSFKTKFPSKKMATAILKWARKRGIQGKTKYKPKSENEKKNVELHKIVRASDDLKSLAYAVSTAIKINGIEPTKFFENAVKATKDFEKKNYADAFRLDIIESLS